VVKIDQIAEGEPFDASAVSMRRPIHIPLDFADSLVFFPALVKRLHLNALCPKSNWRKDQACAFEFLCTIRLQGKADTTISASAWKVAATVRWLCTIHNTVRSFNWPAAPRVSRHVPFLVKRLQQVAPVFPGSNAKPLDQAGHGRIGRRVLHQRESMRGTAPKPPKRCLMRLPNAMPGFSTAR
jgi:hypothetical protein